MNCSVRHEGRPAGKSEFFCPDCGLTGDMNTDFVVERAAEEFRYVCPDCGWILSRRPDYD